MHRCHRKAKAVAKVAAGEEIGDSTLLDAAHQYEVSRGRSCREQLAGAAGQRKLDRGIDWALSPRFAPGFG